MEVINKATDDEVGIILTKNEVRALAMLLGNTIGTGEVVTIVHDMYWALESAGAASSSRDTKKFLKGGVIRIEGSFDEEEPKHKATSVYGTKVLKPKTAIIDDSMTYDDVLDSYSWSKA